jgi:RHS repeat-associated protein
LLSIVIASDAKADCPVSLSIGGRDAAGMLTVNASTQGDCGASSVSLYVDGSFKTSKGCSSSPTCDATFQVSTSCWPTGSYSLEARAACNIRNSSQTCVAHTGKSAQQSVSIDNTPTVTLSMGSIGPDWHAEATITAHFQTNTIGHQYIQLLRDGTSIHGGYVNNGSQDVTRVVDVDLTCIKGPMTFKAKAMTCGDYPTMIGGTPVPDDPSHIAESNEVTLTASPKATATLSIPQPGLDGKTTATITVNYPYTTGTAHERWVYLIKDGVLSQPVTLFKVNATVHSATFTHALDVSCQPPATYQVVTTMCSVPITSTDPDYISRSNTVTVERDWTTEITLTPQKLGIDPSTGRRIIKATMKYDFKKPDGYLSLWVLPWITAKGESRSQSMIFTKDDTGQSGTVEHTFVAYEGARQLRMRVNADGCTTETFHASIECGECDGGATGNPVYLNDGNMRFTDAEPLPVIAGLTLSRAYDSDEMLGGLFGRGWTSLFERRVMGSQSNPSIVTAKNEIVTFKLVNTQYVQAWPLARRNHGLLSYNATTGLYTHREAGSNEEAVFSAATHRLQKLRDIVTGREANFTYDANGLIQTVTDSWTGLAWNITVTTGRITSISVTTRPDLIWTYTYGANNNLVTVAGPGGAAWRTYEFQDKRLTASRDALNNIIESHTYGADGFATSSTGDIDEIQNIEYNLAGATTDERLTRITYKSGAIAEYTLRAVAGAWRPVRITGGCGTCGVRDTTFAYDSRGRVVRKQDADGYVTATVYDGDRILSEERHLRPAACDPATDAQLCRLSADNLISASLVSTTATLKTTYEYADLLWPDRPTAVVTPSVLKAGEFRRQETLYHSATGAVTTTTVRGWTGDTPEETARISKATFYGDPLPCTAPCQPVPDVDPAFTPGGTFAPAWLGLAQPAGLTKSTDGPRTDVQDVTSFVYYPVDATVPALDRGKLAATKNAAGHITHFENYDVFGNATRIVDPNGVATEITADVLGRVLTSTTKGVTGCDTTADPLCASDITSTRTYSPVTGPLASEERPGGGGVTIYTYDARGRAKTISRGPTATDLRERVEYTYDALNGKKSSERMLAYEQSAWVEKRLDSFTYDIDARLQTITHADNTAVHYTYEPDGKVATLRDENHAAANTSYNYDPAGRLSSVSQTLTSAAGGAVATTYAYDGHGNLTAVTDPNGNVTEYVYDDFGQLLSQESPVSGTTLYEYDASGQLTETTDANNAVTTRTYDALGRPLTSVSARAGKSTETITWTYDDTASGRFAIGRLASMIDPAGTTAYHYDRRGFLRKEDRTFAGSTGTYTTAFIHSAAGDRASVRYPSAVTVNYQYDYASRPTSAATAQATLVSSATYLPFGPATSIVYGNGTTQTMPHDNRYRMLENKLVGPTGTIAEYDYTWDDAGNVTAITDAVDATFNRAFAYDDLNRLITANTGTSLWSTGSYSYDVMGNMLSSKIGDPTLSILAQEAYFTYSGTTPKVATVRNNNLVDTGELVTAGNPRLRLSRNAVGYHTVSYDATGNELSYVAGRSYSARNLLEWVQENGETPNDVHRLEYRYDGRGVRVIRSETQSGGAKATRYSTYSPEFQLLSVTKDDIPNVWGANRIATNAVLAAKYDFVWFAGRPLAQISSDYTDGPHWYFTDHLGTPILQTNTSGAVIWRVEYEPYGQIWRTRVPEPVEEGPTPNIDQPLRFPGQEAAMSWEGTEERYNIFRWYRAGWGRYTQSDPKGIKGGLNLYAYVLGNPLTYVDPLGLAACKSGKCADCPGGAWGYQEAFYSWGFIYGQKKGTATYICPSSGLSCGFKLECESVGVQLGLGIGGGFGNVKGKDCKCVEDLPQNASLDIGILAGGGSWLQGKCSGVGISGNLGPAGKWSLTGSLCNLKLISCSTSPILKNEFANN